MNAGIFDMDGLLLDSERIYQRVWRELAAERGRTLGEDFTLAISGTSGDLTLEVLRRYFPGEDPAAVAAECRRRVFEYPPLDIPLLPGVREILSGMRAAAPDVAQAVQSETSFPVLIPHPMAVMAVMLTEQPKNFQMVMYLPVQTVNHPPRKIRAISVRVVLMFPVKPTQQLSAGGKAAIPTTGMALLYPVSPVVMVQKVTSVAAAVAQVTAAVPAVSRNQLSFPKTSAVAAVAPPSSQKQLTTKKLNIPPFLMI